MRENRITKFRAWDGLRMTASGIMFSASSGNVFTASNMPLMQFTGLLDKNGKEIWEGDIVKFQWSDIWISPVFWDDRYGWAIHSIKEWQYNLACHVQTVEVIGNIWERELLEK